jgi:hypothetical protein
MCPLIFASLDCAVFCWDVEDVVVVEVVGAIVQGGMWKSGAACLLCDADNRLCGSCLFASCCLLLQVVLWLWGLSLAAAGAVKPVKTSCEPGNNLPWKLVETARAIRLFATRTVADWLAQNYESVVMSRCEIQQQYKYNKINYSKGRQRRRERIRHRINTMTIRRGCGRAIPSSGQRDVPHTPYSVCVAGKRSRGNGSGLTWLNPAWHSAPLPPRNPSRTPSTTPTTHVTTR